jgi:hypothetical protein
VIVEVLMLSSTVRDAENIVLVTVEKKMKRICRNSIKRQTAGLTYIAEGDADYTVPNKKTGMMLLCSGHIISS